MGREEGEGERVRVWSDDSTDLNIGPATADEASLSSLPVSGTNHCVDLFPGSSTPLYL